MKPAQLTDQRQIPFVGEMVKVVDTVVRQELLLVHATSPLLVSFPEALPTQSARPEFRLALLTMAWRRAMRSQPNQNLLDCFSIWPPDAGHMLKRGNLQLLSHTDSINHLERNSRLRVIVENRLVGYGHARIHLTRVIPHIMPRTAFDMTQLDQGPRAKPTIERDDAIE